MPLCDSRLIADEEVPEKTARDEGKVLEWNRERIVAKAKEILGETELQKLAHPEESQEEEKVPPPQKKGRAA